MQAISLWEQEEEFHFGWQGFKISWVSLEQTQSDKWSIDWSTEILMK